MWTGQEPTTELPPEDRSVILTALSKAMAEVGMVTKGSKNEFHGYSYVSEADLLRALRPAMLNQGLLLLPTVENVSQIDEHGNVFVSMLFTLCHISGAVWPYPIRSWGCGNDRHRNGVGDKGVYKAITGATKYALFKLFLIETGDDPEVANSQETEEVPTPRGFKKGRDVVPNPEDPF